MEKFIRTWSAYAVMTLLAGLVSACGGKSNSTTIPVATANPTVYFAHSVAMGNNSSAMVWGNNSYGQLGNNTVLSSAAPSFPLSIFGVRVRGISAGGTHTLAVSTSGAVWAWGNNGAGQLGDGLTVLRLLPYGPIITGVQAVAAGGLHSLALGSDGIVRAWGYNVYGQLGVGTVLLSYATPQLVVGGDAGGSVLSDITAIAAGGSHSLALRSDGKVFAWGFNGFGQLGDKTGINRIAPVFSNTSGVRIGPQTISAGGSHSAAVRNDGTVWTWGYNVFGQLGDGTTNTSEAPIQVPGVANVVAVSAGLDHTVALKADGTVWAWGYNGLGQVGNNPFQVKSTDFVSTPFQVLSMVGNAVQPLDNVKQVMAFGNHTIAVKNDGTVWAWGNNIYGQLGISEILTTATYSKIAIQVPLSGISFY